MTTLLCSLLAIVISSLFLSFLQLELLNLSQLVMYEGQLQGVINEHAVCPPPSQVINLVGPVPAPSPSTSITNPWFWVSDSLLSTCNIIPSSIQLLYTKGVSYRVMKKSESTQEGKEWLLITYP